MREIKFRAWDKRNNIMVYVSDIDFQDESIGVIEIHSQYDFDEIELMQYIGLKDKNGVEIYEGDIVSHPDDIPYNIKFKVEFGNGKFEFVYERKNNTNDIRQAIECSNIVEVIGNIYENPELIQKGN